MKLVFYPYKMFSQSAKVLARALSTKRVKSNGRYVPKRKHIIVNWGSSVTPNWWSYVGSRAVEVLNAPAAVKVAKNKLATLQALRGANILVPHFTTSREEAVNWIEDDEKKVMCRTLLESYGGKGIVVAKEVEDLVSAPLYTRYVKKSHEFRVHVFKGAVIDYVQKKKKNGVEPTNSYVRNVENGWVFCREDIEVRDDVKALAISAIAALGLDFGAVDIIRGKDNRNYVLEINTAIGMEGTTVERYREALANYAASKGSNGIRRL